MCAQHNIVAGAPNQVYLRILYPPLADEYFSFRQFLRLFEDYSDIQRWNGEDVRITALTQFLHEYALSAYDFVLDYFHFEFAENSLDFDTFVSHLETLMHIARCRWQLVLDECCDIWCRRRRLNRHDWDRNARQERRDAEDEREERGNREQRHFDYNGRANNDDDHDRARSRSRSRSHSRSRTRSGSTEVIRRNVLQIDNPVDQGERVQPDVLALAVQLVQDNDNVVDHQPERELN